MKYKITQIIDEDKQTIEILNWERVPTEFDYRNYVFKVPKKIEKMGWVGMQTIEDTLCELRDKIDELIEEVNDG